MCSSCSWGIYAKRASVLSLRFDFPGIRDGRGGSKNECSRRASASSHRWSLPVEPGGSIPTSRNTFPRTMTVTARLVCQPRETTQLRQGRQKFRSQRYMDYDQALTPRKLQLQEQLKPQPEPSLGEVARALRGGSDPAASNTLAFSAIQGNNGQLVICRDTCRPVS
jgi:hypothetical protein